MAVALGENIRRRRVELGMTRTELAEKIDRSYNHVYGIECGFNTALEEILQRIADALDLPIEQVMKSDRPEPEQPTREPNPTSKPEPTRPEPPPNPTKSPARMAEEARDVA